MSVSPEQKGQRLDQFVAHLPGLPLSRSQAQKLIADAKITVNDAAVDSSYKLKSGDRLSITIPQAKKLETLPEEIPLDIIYEDNALIVVNKPRGLVVHPAPGHYQGTLVNALLNHCCLSSLGAPLRPGIVHRLDKDTSGLIIAAKTDAAYAQLVKQFKNRQVEKTYLALVQGHLTLQEGIIDVNIGRHPVNRKKMSVIQSTNLKSRTALTSYRVLKTFKNASLVEVKIKTGRTHQIRVHFSYLGHPLVGDTTYGGKKGLFEFGQLLHAAKIKFFHPSSGEIIELTAPLPQAMEQVVKQLETGSQ